jgi:hypothetical protein
LFLNNTALSVSTYNISKQADIIIFQPMATSRTSKRALFVHTTTMNEQKVVFISRTDMDKHMEKIAKQFAMTNSSPSACIRMFHRMDDRLYDVQTVSNIFNNTKKNLLEEKGVDKTSTKAQQFVDFLMTNPDTNAVIVIRDPSSALIFKVLNLLCYQHYFEC